ncbi:DUF4870 domain-containing protein [Pedobacter alluvionis]|uniref:Putative membrane protein n=1 Tax=Pedobacter alluvionis TaxID=475253 RepID=A0A497YBU0_9SPHI|nr:DUF4870 domain-containing protein [Pedobacter alluvionis]RLJ79947.1 putative membrane protein [Pedobacter alluvionis]TFB31251.1 hypothetical protein E3V97_11630 [Pedobacter alluvionis]
METNSPFKTVDSGKNAAVVSYIFLLGWLISYFAMYKDNKTALSSYHLRQSLLLHLGMIVLYVAVTILIMIVPIALIGYLSFVVYIAYIILIIIGAISANNSEQKPLPLIGDKAQTMFPSI